MGWTRWTSILAVLGWMLLPVATGGCRSGSGDSEWARDDLGDVDGDVPAGDLLVSDLSVPDGPPGDWAADRVTDNLTEDRLEELDAATDPGDASDSVPEDSTQEIIAPPGWCQVFEGEAKIACDVGLLQVRWLDSRVVRLTHDVNVPPRPTYGIEERQFWPPEIPVQTEVGPSTCTMTTAGAVLAVDYQGCRVRVWDSEGHLLVDDGDRGYDWANSIPGQEVALERTTPPGERFYGLGEKTGPLNRRGRSFEFWNSDTPAYSATQDPLYQSIPFFVGFRDGAAYGVYVDNTHRMTFDMAASSPDRYRLEAQGGVMDEYILIGPGLPLVLQLYAVLTGFAPLPPRWTLGYHQCRWSYYPDSQVLDICQQFRDREIPADGIWLDIDYMEGFRSWTWSSEGFSDPAGLVQQVEELGFKVTAIIDPGLKQDPEWGLYQQGLDNDYFLKNPDGSVFVGEVWPGASVFPDFTHPQVRDWWGSLVHYLTDFGVKGIWLDMNEPASFLAADGNTVPSTVKCDGDGEPTDMGAMHNVYALQENRATYEGLLAAVPDARPFLLTRAGFAGIQRYAAVWTGDAASTFEGLGLVLPMLMGLGMSGVPFVGSDVGGWSGHATPELFARWMAVGSISPFFRGHVQTGVPMQEPWEFGLEVEDISRKHIQQRYRWLPYLYSLFREASLTGHPILRPLVYEFPDNEATLDTSDEAMLGPWLLVAPVVQEGAVSRIVTLPPGQWMEVRSGALHQGPAQLTLDVTLQALPVYLRQGAILPASRLLQYSDQEPLSPLFFELFPGPEETSFELYEDDGETLQVQSGKYCIRTCRLKAEQEGMSFHCDACEGSCEPPERLVALRIRRVDHAPSSVESGGQVLPALSSYSSLFDADGDWVFSGQAGHFYDPNDKALWVVFPDGGSFDVHASYDTSLTEMAPSVLLDLIVDVPEGTSETTPVHVATSSSGWQQVPLSWGPLPGQASGSIVVPRGEWFEYKYTRGNWETVEKWAGCQEAENRYEFGAAHPVKRDEVTTWADWCP